MPPVIVVLAWPALARNPAHGASPNTATLTNDSTAKVTAAPTKLRHRPPATSATGASTANCGLHASNPRHPPAIHGRVSASTANQPKHAAVKKPFWPVPAVTSMPGNASAGSSETPAGSRRRSANSSGSSPAARNRISAGQYGSSASGRHSSKYGGG